MIGKTPAYADWQFTKWGMTPEEVKEAAGDKYKFYLNTFVVPGTAAPDHIQWDTSYTTGKFKFQASFYFKKNTNKLYQIYLFPLSIELMKMDLSKCRDLHSALISKYGVPIELPKNKATRNFVWLDKERGNMIKFLLSVSPEFIVCNISYSRLLVKEIEGL